MDFGHWNFDYDEWDRDYESPLPFEAKCKWCGTDIRMTPSDAGWRPMKGGKLHVCEARMKQERAKLVSLLPDLSTPQCQFCETHMRYEKFTDDESWTPWFQLVCPSCFSTGPKIERGHEKYGEIRNNKA